MHARSSGSSGAGTYPRRWVLWVSLMLVILGAIGFGIIPRLPLPFSAPAAPVALTSGMDATSTAPPPRGGSPKLERWLSFEAQAARIPKAAMVTTSRGTLRLARDGTTLQLTLHSTGAQSAGELTLWQRATCTELARWQITAPDTTIPYQNSLPIGSLTLDDLAVTYTGDLAHEADVADEAAQDIVLLAYGPTACLDFTPPPPHLGYGVNVWHKDLISQLAEPMGFDWVRLWDDYAESQLPLARPVRTKVLYNLNCGAYVNDMAAWRSRIRSMARAGLGQVQAYEICNEPNIKNANMGDSVPDPVRFTEMLCIAHQEIKAVDPEALIISGGLAPVGRVAPPTCGPGNDCNAMDERIFLQGMLDHGAGACIDAFGYHPYGFAFPPETDPASVENGFTFRGVEALHDVLVSAGCPDMPVWATELNWIRRPAEDGYEMSCDTNTAYNTYFKWQEVSAAVQADYLVRAFQYADANWPWMQGMFVWNLDWHDYLTWEPCFHSRYYALRRRDGSYPGTGTPAYAALTAMPKRPGLLDPPWLTVEPTRTVLLSEAARPRVLSTSLMITNTGSGLLNWKVTTLATSTLHPTLATLGGPQGSPLTVTVDTAGLKTGTYTATLVIDALPVGVLNAPQTVHVVLKVMDELEHTYLPVIMRRFTPPPPPVPSTDPYGPSKIGVHAIGEGDTLRFVQQVADGGGHVAVVKGVLSFGYLCDVKRISPETITIGRWAKAEWEVVQATGDPAAVARRYIDEHMKWWAPYKDCVDYWEILNEVDPSTIEGHAWLGEFFKAAMTIAEENGYKLALFSYSLGVPEVYEWAAIVDTGVFAQAKAGGHILSLHEYGWPLMRDFWGEPLPQYPGQDPHDPSVPRYPDRGAVTGRYRHLYRDFLIPRNEVIPLVITETNLGMADPVERAEYFLEEIAWYDDRLREDDYVLGMTIFTLGGGFSQWDHFDFTEFLPALTERVVRLSSARTTGR